MTIGATRTALITGASRGLGLALARQLSTEGWQLIIDARGAEALEAARSVLARQTRVIAISGDVTDSDHRRELVGAARDLGGLDALVNNASLLGPSPQPELLGYPLEVLEQVYRTNVIAPLAVIQVLRHELKTGAPAGAATAPARPRSNSSRPCSPWRTRRCASTGSTPAICARRCTRRLFLVRILVIVLYQKKVFPLSLSYLRVFNPVDVILLAYC